MVKILIIMLFLIVILFKKDFILVNIVSISKKYSKYILLLIIIVVSYKILGLWIGNFSLVTDQMEEIFNSVLGIEISSIIPNKPPKDVNAFVNVVSNYPCEIRDSFLYDSYKIQYEEFQKDKVFREVFSEEWENFLKSSIKKK